MKKIFEILQKGWCPVILGIIFAAVPKWQKDFGMLATVTILIASSIVLLLVFWNLFSSWEVKKQGYLVANGGVAGMGVVSSLIIFAYAYGEMNYQQMHSSLLISFCLGMAIFLWGIYWDWCKRPWDENKQKVSSPKTSTSPHSK